MNKTIIIGDIHGRDIWKQIVKKEQDATRIVFIGDYFDSFDEPGVVQLQNFLDIVEFKKTSTKEVILLFGNHDYHYMPGYTLTGYSGYQPAMSWQFRDAINQNLQHLQMCYLFDNVLCSHAGVGMKWVEKHFENTLITNLESVSMLVDTINDHFKYKPNIFDFCGWDPYGDSVTQTPIWIRPASLNKVNKNTKLKELVVQVVGHTQQTNLNKSLMASEKTYGNKLFLCDCLHNNQYLIYNGKFEVGQI